jgi:hypothetical protein
MIRDNADNNSDAFLLMYIWKQVVKNDKKKRMKKKERKNEKERCIDENISFCYQGVVRKKKVFSKFH